MTAESILNKFYNNITEEEYPGFDYNDDEVQAELLPPGYDDVIVWGIYEAKPEWMNILAEDGYAVVYHVIGKYDDTIEFIGAVIGRRLYDVTEELNYILRDDGVKEEMMSFDQSDRIAYGEELYHAYGPDVDPEDLDEYDAECYLAYKRSIGE